MARQKLIYDFDQDKAFIEIDGRREDVTCFKFKAQLEKSDIEISYWPNTKEKRNKAVEINKRDGRKVPIELL